LGKVVSRKLKQTQYTTSLSGAPDANYAALRSEQEAIETIVPMLDKGGRLASVGGLYQM
jgi:hypothetical protein